MARKKITNAPSDDLRYDILERVTRAEGVVTRLDKVQIEWREEMRDAIEEDKKAHESIASRLTALETALTKYQGAWGMLTILFSAVIVAVTLMKDWLIDKFTR